MTLQVEEVKGILTKAIDMSGKYTWSDVYSSILSGDAQLWTGKKSAIVTYISDFPKGKTLCVFLGGGELEEIKYELLPTIEEWARLEGCTQAEIVGRHGWERVLKDYKNSKKVNLVKDL